MRSGTSKRQRVEKKPLLDTGAHEESYAAENSTDKIFLHSKGLDVIK